MPWDEFDGGGPPRQPPTPATPPAPPTAGQQQQGVETQQTAAQRAGYHGETRESGSDPNRGEKHWDPAWEKRMRNLLGDESVGGEGDLYDPKHREWLNRQARKKRGESAGAGGAAAGEEATQPLEEAAAEAPTPTPQGQLPVAQGGATQWANINAGEQLGGLFPERQVPGGDQERAMPGGNMDKDRQGPASEDLTTTGAWTSEDQARQEGAATERPATGTGGTGGAGGGTWSQPAAGEQRIALAEGQWTGPTPDKNVRQPTEQWPTPSLPPLYYTGGM